MKGIAVGVLKGLGLLLLGVALIYVVWQPVVPSRWIIERMAKAVEAPDLPAGEERIIRFDLSGKGGGVYNLVLRKGGVQVVEGRNTERLDLVLFMEARDFNSLMMALARGKADEFTFRRLTVSKVMRFGGDVEVFKLLSRNEKEGD